MLRVTCGIIGSVCGGAIVIGYALAGWPEKQGLMKLVNGVILFSGMAIFFVGAALLLARPNPKRRRRSRDDDGDPPRSDQRPSDDDAD